LNKIEKTLVEVPGYELKVGYTISENNGNSSIEIERIVIEKFAPFLSDDPGCMVMAMPKRLGIASNLKIAAKRIEADYDRLKEFIIKKAFEKMRL